MITLYGIRNCDTVRRARQWLDAHGVAHAFHDFRAHGVPSAALERWLEMLGWETLVNRRGTTWRGLDEAERAAVVDTDSARRALHDHPSLIRRPVVEWTDGQSPTVGFDEAQWQSRAPAAGEPAYAKRVEHGG